MTHLNSSTLLLGHFANLKLAGDRAVRDAILSLQSTDPTLSTSSAMRTIFKNPAPSSSRRRRRKPRIRSSSRLHSLTDADLEAELVSRRAARARERDRYARAMRSEKLSVLESELARLRFEIARLDKGAASSFTGSGTPPNAKWQSFPQARRSLQRNVPASKPPSLVPRVAPSAESVSGSGPSGPPPPPPPPQLGGPSVAGGEGEDVVPDLEKRRREKEERQRRREAKRKEREAAKKPMTLADIIRSAGPDPARRLKPSGSTALPDVNDPKDEEKGGMEIGTLKEGLKKVEQRDEQNGKGEEKSEKRSEDQNKAEIVETRPVDNNVATVDAQGAAKESGKPEEILGNSKIVGDGKPTETGKSESGSLDQEKPKSDNATLVARDARENPVMGNGDEGELTKAKTAGENGRETHATISAGEVRKDKSTETKTQLKTLGTPSGHVYPKEGKSESAGDGGATEAIAAISAFAASLPAKKKEENSAKRSEHVGKSLEERRRLRRASMKVRGNGVGQRRVMEGTELDETAKSVNGLKVD